MKILVTGATGLIGRSFCQLMTNEGHAVIALSRAPQNALGLPAAAVHKWEPLAGPPPAEALREIDSVIHLAGEPIADGRWSVEQKKRIKDSRVISTRNLVEGLRRTEVKPGSLISGSAVGFYGDRKDEMLDEHSQAGTGFLSNVCSEWEAEAERLGSLPIRVVRVRTGVVLSSEGGALKKMLPAFKLGVAGRLGNGRQWFPWIHIADMVGLLRHAVLTSSLAGPMNATSPESVTNAEFTRQLGRVLHRPTALPVPEFALRLLMGEMADALLGSQRVIPRVAEESGYQFRFLKLTAALEDLLHKRVAKIQQGKAAGA